MSRERGPDESEERRQLVSKGLAVLLVGVLLRYWRLALTAVSVPPWSALGVVTLLFIALLVLSMIGLWRGRVWGFYCAYGLVPVSTVLHGIPLVPFISDLLPTLNLRIGAVLVFNIGFLITVVLLHWQYRQDPQDPDAAARPA